MKKVFSLALALALCLGLAAPAFAESMSAENTYTKVTFSDVVSRRVIPGVSRAYAVYDVNAGSTMVVENIGASPESSGRTFSEGYINSDGWYDVVAGGSTFNTGVADGTPFTLTNAQAGLWFFADTPPSTAGFFLNVIAGDDPVPSTPEQPTTPTVTVEDIPARGTARMRNQTVTIDGTPVKFQMYALLDENGNSTNYVKLRDLAHILNGTAAQFSVDHSNETGITIKTGSPYQDNGSEMKTPFSGSRSYTGGPRNLHINGSTVALTAINLRDDLGGGYTYFKLRDLGIALGFNVGWTAERGVYVETDKPYQG